MADTGHTLNQITLRVLKDQVRGADTLLKECQKVLQCHARCETKDLRERISRFRKGVSRGYEV
jgi:hypothetical protein